MLRPILFFVLVTTFVSCNYDYPVARGAQIRLTAKGLQYGASIGIRTLERELTNKNVPSQKGSAGSLSYSAYNIFLNYLRVGSYNVQPLAGNGMRLSVSGVTVSASARVYARYGKGWFKISDTTNVKIFGKGVGFSLDIKIAASNNKPTLQTTRCSAHISDLDLNFSGGLSWLYNLFSSLLEGKLERVLENVICAEGTKLINGEANKFLYNFPVRQNIDKYAIIDYSFEQPFITSNYIDFLLRGEFLDRYNPVPSKTTPPSFTTMGGSDKMAYVWISCFTLNTAGKVIHDSGLLKNVISPIVKSEIPDTIKPFLNTNSFVQIIPQLYNAYPNRPIEFHLRTSQAPTFKIVSGFVDVNLHVKAAVSVVLQNTRSIQVFYLNLNVKALASAMIKSVNTQLIIGGHISNFSFTATVGGSVIGDLHIPLDNPSIKAMVHGLVIDQANPVLNKGFPIPKIKDLDFVNPAVAIVKDAIRVETDVAYHG